MKKSLLIFISIIFIFTIYSFSEKEEEISVKEVIPFTYCAISHQGPFTEIQNVIQKINERNSDSEYNSCWTNDRNLLQQP